MQTLVKPFQARLFAKWLKQGDFFCHYMDMKEAEYLKPREVAEKLRIHERTVLRLLSAGELPGAVRVGTKTWRISAVALRAYIEAGGGAIPKGKKAAKRPQGKPEK